ncbi:hypothetical protein QUF84_00550 [Fictibacillus enclensis]|uniref:DUF5415 family protein n=1 Tax=Fictibacillus enclensis TaxID=1017270 RepID=UPI0025A0BF43|nr:hypothetical protein [Fictibacillus enclensis]MDM5335786.1 hypothetical protein [Fictibacillus enclensis]
MATRKREQNKLQKTAQTLLEKEGIDFQEWKKDILNKRKLAVMADEDKEWTERTIDEEALKLVMDKIDSVTPAYSSTQN